MKLIRGSFKSHIAKGEGEQDVEVHYLFIPASPAQMYDRHGDPGHDAEAAEAEILSVTEIYPVQYSHLGGDVVGLLSERDIERLEAEAIAHAELKREVEMEHDHGGEA